MSHERFHPTIGIRYKDIQGIKTIVDKIKLMLLQNQGVDHHLPIDVFFINFGATSLDIEISAYIATSSDTRFSCN